MPYYIDCETSFVPNTTMQIFVNSLGNQTQYVFRVNDGYVIHDNRCDAVDELEGTYTERFATGRLSVSINYDFTTLTQGIYEGVDGTTYNVTKIGEFELYTLPESAVPIDHTYGGGNNHDVM